MKLKDTALVIVDMLYDFIDGSMACEGADAAISGTLAFIKDHPEVPFVFIRDCHPENHCSFVAQGGPWPKSFGLWK